MRASKPPPFSDLVKQANRFAFTGLKQRKHLVVAGGRESVGPDYKISRGGFPFLAIECVAGGSGSLVLAGQSHPLTPGTLFTYGPGVAHDITTHPVHTLQKFFVDVAAPAAHPLLKSAGLGVGRVWHVVPMHPVMTIFDQLVQAGCNQGAMSRSVCDHLFQALLYQAAQSARVHTSVAPRSWHTYQRCLELIERECHHFRTLEQAAAVCRIRPAVLCRLFKRFDTRTPYQHLIASRMSQAAIRLRSGDALVKEVAAQFGYSDPFHFSRVFKKTLGVSPSAYGPTRQIS